MDRRTQSIPERSEWAVLKDRELEIRPISEPNAPWPDSHLQPGKWSRTMTVIRAGLADGAPCGRKKSEPKGELGLSTQVQVVSPPKSLKAKSLSCVRLFATPQTAAHQAPPSMGFSRHKDWSGCHCLLHLSFCQPQTPTKYKSKTKPVDFTDLGLVSVFYLEWPASTFKAHSSFPRARFRSDCWGEEGLWMNPLQLN